MECSEKRRKGMMQELYNECLTYFNEPVLHVFEVGRLVGYAEDEDDCYSIIKLPHGRRCRCTMVCGVMSLRPLKGQRAYSTPTGQYWDDYTNLDEWLELNGAGKELNFILDVK